MMQRRLRVALLATVVDFGGSERVLLTLLQNMQADVVLCPVLFTRGENEGNHFLESLEARKVPYDAIAVDASRFKYINPLRNIGEAIDRIKGRNFDLIHSHGYRADFIGLIVSRYLGLPIVSTCHGYISTDWRLSFYNRLDTFLLRYFNRVIAVSESMRADLIERGVAEDKIQVVANAVLVESRSDSAQNRREIRLRLGIEPDEFVFGYIGRLSEEKGLGYLIEALKGWEPKDFRWRLVLVGDGPNRSPLEDAVRSHELTERVFFAGFQPDTAAWYPAMDAFVLPSLTEGTPMALLEAMAIGLPVIATSVGGVPALVSNGENGILVPPSDPSSLQGAMQSIARDGDLRRRLCSRALDLIRRDYNVPDWIRNVTEIYATTLQEARKRGK